MTKDYMILELKKTSTESVQFGLLKRSHAGTSRAHPELLAFVELMLCIRSLLATSFKLWINFASGWW